MLLHTYTHVHILLCEILITLYDQSVKSCQKCDIGVKRFLIESVCKICYYIHVKVLFGETFIILCCQGIKCCRKIPFLSEKFSDAGHLLNVLLPTSTSLVVRN